MEYVASDGMGRRRDPLRPQLKDQNDHQRGDDYDGQRRQIAKEAVERFADRLVPCAPADVLTNLSPGNAAKDRPRQNDEAAELWKTRLQSQRHTRCETPNQLPDTDVKDKPEGECLRINAAVGGTDGETAAHVPP